MSHSFCQNVSFCFVFVGVFFALLWQQVLIIVCELLQSVRLEVTPEFLPSNSTFFSYRASHKVSDETRHLSGSSRMESIRVWPHFDLFNLRRNV